MTVLLRIGPYLAAAAALIGAYLSINNRSYACGYAAKNAEVLKDAARLTKQADRVRGVMDAQAIAIQTTAQAQDAETRIITNETTRIIKRPAYRLACIDADGIRLLDRAVANANREPPGLSDGAPAFTPAISTERWRDDERRAVPRREHRCAGGRRGDQVAAAGLAGGGAGADGGALSCAGRGS